MSTVTNSPCSCTKHGVIIFREMAARAMIKLTLCVGMILTVRGAPQRRDTTKIPLKMPQVSPKVVCVAIFGCYLCQVVFIL